MTDTDKSPAPDDAIKRPRPVLSCLECRRKKLKCDRLLPCQQCKKHSRSSTCNYSNGTEPDTRTEPEGRTPKRARRTPDVDGLNKADDEKSESAKGVGALDDLRDRVSRLEEAIGLAGETRGVPINGTSVFSAASTAIQKSRYHAHRKRLTLLSPFDEARSFMYKIISEPDDPGLAAIARDLRALYAATKPPRPQIIHSPLTIDDICKKMTELLPSQSTCNHLVSLYFENFENCLRTLHRPSFVSESRRFWESWQQCGYHTFTELVPMLLLVLSIASSLDITPECKEVLLDGSNSDPSAIDLIQRWIDFLPFKQKYTLSVLQLRVLMIFPQRGRSTKIEEVWNLSGQNVRQAMAMGIHQVPNTKHSIFEAGMKRRLWFTIVEHDLTMSLMCGMPTMLSSDDLVITPPLNINDSDLFEEMSELPGPRPMSEWTDSLCQCVLANTIGRRLDAYRYLSNPRTEVKYVEMMKHSRALEQILQDLPAPLKFDYVMDQASSRPGRLFARMTLDVFIRRILLNLYTPFAFSIPVGDTFKEARDCYIQSCLVLLCYQDLFDPKFSELDVPHQNGYWDAFYKIHKHDILQTILGVCFEIKRLSSTSHIPAPRTNIPDRASSLPTSRNHLPNRIQPWSRASLVKGVEDSIEPLIRRISRPGSDPKDLMCLEVVLQSVRTSHEQKEELIKEGVKDLILACQRQLQRDGIAIPSPDTTSSSDGMNGLLDLSNLPDLPSFNFQFAINAFPDMGASMGYNENIAWNFN